MSIIYVLTQTNPNIYPQNQQWFFESEADAELHRDLTLEGFFLKQHLTANRIKGAIRGKGQRELYLLAQETRELMPTFTIYADTLKEESQ